MAVRDSFPDSIAFTLEIRFQGEQSYRVRVHLDRLERQLTLPSGILPDILDHIDEFLRQLSRIASNQWSFELWDGDSDDLQVENQRMTEFQQVRIYPVYRLDGDRLYFNIGLGDDESLLTPIG